MTVSVVIPAYNCGPYIAETVRSVLAQTRPAAEVVVVDDGSADDTAGRAAEFGPPVRCVRQPNGGVSAARNRGVAEATGRYVAFLDGDDVWHPRKLELQLAALEADPELGLLGAGHYPWPAEHPVVTDPVPPPVRVRIADLLIRNPFIASGMVVRADVLKAVGPFDTAQQGTEDHDLWLRVAQRAAVANLPVPLVGYRTGAPGSLSKDAARMEAGMRVILGKLEAAGVFRGRPLLRRKAWGYFRYSCGYMHHRAGNRGAAAGHLALSLLGYPLPYPRADVRYRFGRARLLAACLKSGTRA